MRHSRVIPLAVLSALSAACSEVVSPVDDAQLGVRRFPGVLPDTSKPASTTPFVVVFRQDVRDPDGLTDALLAAHGGKASYRYRSVVKGFAGNLPAQAVEALRRNPLVESVDVDAMVIHQSESTSQSGVPWGLDRIDQRAIVLDGAYLYTRTGAGVTVYLVDSGIRYTHSEFEGRATFGFDSFGDDGSDCSGHGTHVAGSIGGKTFGVAKEVQLVSVRTLNCSGSGYVSGIIAGLDWIAANVRLPAVANLSIGAPAYDPLDRAVRRLTQLGVTVVVAASNYNADACNYSPARERSAITVGASNEYDRKASFSNWGACVDLFAPGYGILSAGYLSDDTTAYKSGTSMATPHVAGAAALYLEGSPAASTEEVATAIQQNATLGIVTEANSANNHLLFAGSGAVPPPPPPPPPPSEPPPPPPPPPPPVEEGVVLEVIGVKEKGKATLRLSWTGAESEAIQVRLDDAELAVVANTGSYQHQPPGKGRRTYSFQVCELDGQARCSNTVSITF